MVVGDTYSYGGQIYQMDNMTTQINNLKSMSKTYLVFGIFFFVLGSIVNFILFETTKHTEGSNINSILIQQLKSLPPILLIIIPVIFIPIFEEFAFRGWTKLTVPRKLISIFLSVIYVQLLFDYIAITAIALVSLFFLMFKVKKNMLFINILFMSLFFAVVHINNFTNPIFAIGGIISLFGAGLILSYVSFRFGIIFSIILHIINNSIAFLPLLFIANNDDSFVVFEGETYSAELRPASLFGVSNNYIFSDSVNIMNDITGIAVKLAPFENDIIYSSVTSSLATYNLKVYSKSSLEIDLNALFNDFLELNKIKSDTLIKEAFVLEKKSDFLYLPTLEPTYKTTLFGLVEQIRSKFEIPLWIADDIKDSLYSIEISTISMTSFEDFKDYLLLNQGISILDPYKTKIKYVRFRE